MTIDLTTFGWDEFFKTKFESWAGKDYSAGRVALEHRNLFRVYTEHGEVLAELSGKLRHEAASRSDLPAVGDWVDSFSARTGQSNHRFSAPAEDQLCAQDCWFTK